MKVRSTVLDTALWVGIASVMGMAAVIASYLLSHGYDPSRFYPSPLFPLSATAWERFEPLQASLWLLATGGVLGYLRPRLWWLLGPSTTVLFFLFAIAEMNVNPSSHNLWPFEFVLYLLLIGGPATAGCLLGAGTGLWWKQNAT